MTPARAVLLLLLAAFFWGAGNVANKTVLEHVGPFTAVAVRCLLATCVVLPLALGDFRSLRRNAWMLSALPVAALFAIALTLQQIAFGLTSVTNAGFLINTCSIMTPLMIWALYGDRPGRRLAFAAGLTVVGAFLMAGGHTSLSMLNTGDLLCLLSAFFYAAWMVALGRHALRYGRPFGTSVVQFAVTAVLCGLLAVATETPTATGIRAALPEFLLLGVFSTAAAFVLQTHAQRFLNASTAAVLVSAESLFGALGAFVLLGERTPAMGLFGAALITLAITLAATDRRKRSHDGPAPQHPAPDAPLVAVFARTPPVPATMASGDRPDRAGERTGRIYEKAD
jgi:drug/metabolite transporter (DMT)-like permease